MPSIKGENFEAFITKETQLRINAEAAAEVLTPEQLSSIKREITFDTIKTNRISGEKPVFIPPNTSNYTPAGIVDLLGEVRERMKMLKAEEELYKQLIQAELNSPKKG